MISIIGPPAVGKTTLAEILARKLPAELIREDYAGNPFLADSYHDLPGAALPAQLYFLISRVRQLSLSGRAPDGLFVSDYGFLQDRLYARMRLDAGDFALYRPVLRRVEPLIHRPDLLIHLDAGEAALLSRIRRRGREFENTMTAEFLRDVRNACDKGVADAACPVVRVDCETTDIRRQDALAKLTAEIGQRLAIVN